MTKVIDVLNALEKYAPCRLAESYDNVGFIVGKRDNEVKRVIVALDITSAVIDEAVREGAELIVSHHPIIFGSRKSVTDCDVIGALLIKLIENGISAICMHTNLDSAIGGVNDVFAEKLGIKVSGVVEPKEDGTVGGGRYGELDEECSLSEFLPRVCKVLSARGVKYYDAERKVKRVAVGGGSCGDYITIAASLGCDTLVTADIKHNQFLESRELGVNAIDAGHFATEDIVCPRICEIIKKECPGLSVAIAESDIDYTKFFTVGE